MTDIESIVSTVSVVAVVAGTILVVLQLRVNAKHARPRNAFDLIAPQGVSAPRGRPTRARRHLLAELPVARGREPKVDAGTCVGTYLADAGRLVLRPAPELCARTRRDGP
jgi:hypothetical protein